MSGCTDPDTCPTHALVIEKLNTMKETCKSELENKKPAMWDAIHSKASTKLVLTFITLTVTILLVTVGFTFRTAVNMEKSMIRFEGKQELILEKVENLEEKLQ